MSRVGMDTKSTRLTLSTRQTVPHPCSAPKQRERVRRAPEGECGNEADAIADAPLRWLSLVAQRSTPLEPARRRLPRMELDSADGAAAFSPMQERDWSRSRGAGRLELVHSGRLTLHLRHARNQARTLLAGVRGRPGDLAGVVRPGLRADIPCDAAPFVHDRQVAAAADERRADRISGSAGQRGA